MKSATSPTLTAACILLASEAPDLTAHELAQILHDRRTLNMPFLPQPGRLLDIKETAARLSLGERTVWKLAKAGKLHRVEIGKAVRFREADVAKLARTGVPMIQRPPGPNRRGVGTAVVVALSPPAPMSPSDMIDALLPAPKAGTREG